MSNTAADAASSSSNSLEGDQAIIIGMGRIGTLLAGAQADGLLQPRCVARGAPMFEEGDAQRRGPIYVCTRNDDLEAIIRACPEERRRDLVFVQNGMILSLLHQHGLDGATQALIYFAVERMHAQPADGGGTLAWGPWAEAFAARVRACGCQCKVLSDRTEFNRRMVDKLLWICIFGVLCTRHQGMTVGKAAATRVDDVRHMVDELCPIIEREFRWGEDRGLNRPMLVISLLEYSKKIPDFVAGFKEYPWRNGWFMEREETPVHGEYVRACQEMLAAKK